MDQKMGKTGHPRGCEWVGGGWHWTQDKQWYNLLSNHSIQNAALYHIFINTPKRLRQEPTAGLCLPFWQILHVCASLHVLVFRSSSVCASLYTSMCQLYICVPTRTCQCASLHVCDRMYVLMCLWHECISHRPFVTPIFIRLWLPKVLLLWLPSYFTVMLGCFLIVALNNQLIHCELCKFAIVISLSIAIRHKSFNILMKCQKFVSSNNFIVGKTSGNEAASVELCKHLYTYLPLTGG